MGALFVWSAVCLGEPVQVAQVIDGDSLRLRDGREVRLIGINAPEFGKDGQPDEPLAREARALLAQLVAGKELRLRYGPERHDRYRRTLAHLELPDDGGIEEVLLRQGLAVAIAVPPNLAHVDAYRHAEAEARRAGRGLWAHPYFQPRDPALLGANDAGFRFVRGRVQRLGHGRDTIYLDLAERFALAIPRQHWHYFGGEPQRLVGKQVIARGWVTPYKRGLRLALPHPAMLEVVD